jgi:hypothetical protein
MTLLFDLFTNYVQNLFYLCYYGNTATVLTVCHVGLRRLASVIFLAMTKFVFDLTFKVSPLNFNF